MERFTVSENNVLVRLSFAKDKSERHLRIFVHNEDGSEIYPAKIRRTELIISIAGDRYVPDFASMMRIASQVWFVHGYVGLRGRHS